MDENEYELFPVYRSALELSSQLSEMCGKINRREYIFIKDQLMRASSSIVLNIAEGAGKWTKREKVHYYRISRSSAYESSAAIDLFVRYKLLDVRLAQQFKTKLYKIYCDLSNLIASIGKRKV